MAKQNKKKKNIKERKIPRFLTISDVPKYYQGKEYLKLAEVRKDFNFYTIAGQRVENSKRWFQRLIYANQFILLVSFISVIILAGLLSNDESPTVFVNFKSGTLMCANEPINLKTEKNIGRESEYYQGLCKELGDFGKDN